MQTAPIDAFLQPFDSDDLAIEVARRGDLDPTVVRRRLRTYVNEARTYIAIIKPEIRREERVLEVGAGMGLVARYLRSCGIEVVALEPYGTGFDLFDHVRAEILDRFGDGGLKWLPIGVDDLRPVDHGRFDYIYSLHVLEHVPDVRSAIARMADVLEPGGRMLHICPNYRVPYDPHIGAPAVWAVPRLTELIFPDRIARKRDVWRSLNFVTAGRLRRAARHKALKVRFDRRMMGITLDRYAADPIFAGRHRSLMVRGALLASTLLRRLPGAWQSPMMVRISQD